MSAPGAALCWIDGAVHPLESREARLPVRDRAFLLGEGLFETVRVVSGRPWRLAQHLARLARAAEALELPAPPPEAKALAAAAELLAQFGARDGVLKIVWTAGDPPELSPALVLIATPPRPLPPRAREEGVRIWIPGPESSPEPRPGPLARWKTTCYLDRALLRRRAAARGAWEAILLGPRGEVLEGAATNVFWERGGRLRTPALSLPILPGIAREAAIAEAAAAGIPVEEGAFPAGDLESAGEAFLTNALVGVLPVALSGREGPGPLTRALATRLEERVRAESRDAAGFLPPPSPHEGNVAAP